MPQPAHQVQQQAHVRQPLTPEEAREIAKKSHQRLKAQQAPLPQSKTNERTTKERTPDKPLLENRTTENRGIQVQLVKRTVAGHKPQAMNQQTNRPTLHKAIQPPPLPAEPEHLTREGEPDRRFAENRALPPQGRKSDTFGIHLTKSGRPDRRFIENQHLTVRQAEIEKAIAILKQAGIKVGD